jgi:AbrB family looped-hinge helix DNA binding protein
MALSKMTRNGQITIPKSLRDVWHLQEGDYVEVIKGEEGIVLRPKKVMIVDPDQVYYWSDDWQQREQQADDDIRAGRVYKLNSIDDLDR